jgi:HSP20 family molecular chaperone IbpA
VHAGAGVHVGGGEELQGEVHVQVAAVGRHRFQRDLVVAQEAQRGWIMDTYDNGLLLLRLEKKRPIILVMVG